MIAMRQEERERLIPIKPFSVGWNKYDQLVLHKHLNIFVSLVLAT